MNYCDPAAVKAVARARAPAYDGRTMRRLRANLPPAALAAWAVAAAAILLVLTAPTPAAAIEPIETDPPADSVLGEEPEVIRITFDEPLLLEAGANRATLVDADGNPVPSRAAGLAAYSPRTLLLHPGPALPEDGAVSVRWSVRSAATGEQSSGSFSFALAPGAEGEFEAAAPLVDPREEERSPQSIVLWTVGIVLGVALAMTALYFLRREMGLGESSLESEEEAH